MERVSSCKKLSASIRPSCVFMCAVTFSRHWHADSIICATNLWIQCNGELNVMTK